MLPLRPSLPPLLLAALLAAGPAGAAVPLPVPDTQVLHLAIDGRTLDVPTQVFRPEGAGPFPLVIFSHGRSADPAVRARLQYPVPLGHVAYWLRQGVAVVAPIRPGYGTTGGPDRENSGARWPSGGNVCTGLADYATVAQHAAAAVRAVHGWALQQPWVRRDRILLEGQSVGGMATIAAAADRLPGVVGAVNFSGGAGGKPDAAPGHSCQPQVLTGLYRQWGTQVRVPTLWLYAENDLYWGADLPRQWFGAFREGGDGAQFFAAPALEGTDGHNLLRVGGRHWRDPLQAFTAKVGLLAP
ncbi:alpha/beta hydrolase family protein [Acidovorax sp. NCPPB 4044]|uniref:alpha/beta hydrolase family protein n=1 Tax=Acidovorax sp. NCPPB 4044 TaxID=2940490 RepID=UPI0023046571|nr:dipeptidyl aminopeptidase [Acidovorax sp. NCPPB 4044]MDA8523156.1 dipeptidyl aminopeptidase [Acidovorax sp. NCPPB 4044]